MKKFFLFTSCLEAMVFNPENNLIRKEETYYSINKNTYYENTNSKKKIKMLYGLSVLFSLINLGIFIFNYLVISNDIYSVVGLILNSFQLIASILYLILYNFKLILLKIIMCIYIFFFPWNLLINAMILRSNIDEDDKKINETSIYIFCFSFLIFNLITGFLIFSSFLLQYPNLLTKK